jgi:hypothetical protein
MTKHFAFWADDGDNVLESRRGSIFLQGPLSGLVKQGK